MLHAMRTHMTLTASSTLMGFMAASYLQTASTTLMVRAAGTTTAARTILVAASWRSLGVKTYDDETAAMTHNH